MSSTTRQMRRRIEKQFLMRLARMLEDDATPNADVFKAAALFCDHFRDQPAAALPDTVEVRFTD